MQNTMETSIGTQTSYLCDELHQVKFLKTTLTFRRSGILSMKNLKEKLETISSLLKLIYKTQNNLLLSLIILQAKQATATHSKEKVHTRKKGVFKKIRRQSPTTISKNFLKNFRTSENKPIFLPSVMFFIENSYNLATGEFLEEEVLKFLNDSNSALIIQSLSLEDFGEEVRTMNNKLEQHLHRIDQTTLGCSYGETRKGTLYSLIKKCLERRIKIVPLSFNKEEQQELLLWRASKIAKENQTIRQVWLVKPGKLAMTHPIKGLPGLRNIIKGGKVRAIF